MKVQGSDVGSSTAKLANRCAIAPLAIRTTTDA